VALRPLAFGLRFQHGGRSLRLRPHARDPRRYVVELRRAAAPAQCREHASLAGALRAFAAAWRERLH
jgi:hypothetical protein